MNKSINKQKHKRQTSGKITCFVIPVSNHSVKLCAKEVVDNI
jgi:hypothetical protein